MEMLTRSPLLIAIFMAVEAAPCLAANPLLPLPGDTALSARITVSGRFRSRMCGESKRLTMTTWAAVARTGETIDPANLPSRAFQRLGLPRSSDWGLIEAEDETLEVRIRAADTAGRLQRVRVLQLPRQAVLREFPAKLGQAEETVRVRKYQRDIQVDLLGPAGAPLASILVDLGRWDTVYPIWLEQPLQARRPPLQASPHYTIPEDYAAGPAGEAATLAVLSPLPDQKITPTVAAAAVDLLNDAQLVATVSPPAQLAGFVKRSVAGMVIFPGLYTIGDPSIARAFERKLADTQPDITPAASNAVIPPYTDATAVWRLGLSARDICVLAVPYERVRLASDFPSLERTIRGAAVTGNPFPSVSAMAAARSYLDNASKRGGAGVAVQELLYWGSVVVLEARELSRALVRKVPLSEEVTFTVVSAEAGRNVGRSRAVVKPMGHWTPDPPSATPTTTELQFSQTGIASARLPKGYSWELTLIADPASGLEPAIGAFPIQTPATNIQMLLVQRRPPAPPR